MTVLVILCLVFGMALPAWGQMDFSGEWTPNGNEDSIGNPYVGDWLGIPMSPVGFARSETWSASVQTLPEWQCRPHGFAYIYRGPSQLRISKEVDPVTRQITAFHAEWLRSVDVPIYLDGRPHPPEYAPHTWAGFSTAVWEGDMLKITTTHVKEEYLRRNGVQHSDQITITTYWIRRGDILTWVNIVYDPVYLTEPLIRSQEYRLVLNQQIPPYPCTIVEEVDRPKGVVPHLMPGKNLFLKEFTDKLGISEDAVWGGAETMYPEFRSKVHMNSGLAARVRDQQKQIRSPDRQAPTDNELRWLHVRGPIYMLVGAGGNITVSAGPDGVLMVDAGSKPLTDRVLAAVRQIQQQLTTNGVRSYNYAAETRSNVRIILDTIPVPKPIRYVINTSVDSDHTGGNENIAAAGQTLTGGNVALDLRDAAEDAAVLAHENVLNRLNGPSTPRRALPTNTYFGDNMKLSHFFNGEGIHIIHPAQAHTDGDSIVFFRYSDVISTGDIFLTTTYPHIDLAQGGSINGIIDALNRVLELSIAEFRTEGGTMIIPGHGRLSDSGDVAYYRDMLTIIRDRIQSMLKQGSTLEQVKAAKPTKDYDPRFGSIAGEWTTDMFVEAVYKSLAVASRERTAP